MRKLSKVWGSVGLEFEIEGGPWVQADFIVPLSVITVSVVSSRFNPPPLLGLRAIRLLLYVTTPFLFNDVSNLPTVASCIFGFVPRVCRRHNIFRSS